ncbi:MAG TPA: hypothetical protein VFK05_09000, partial [Polyangiaceae bacterium]|nr:hypothetical protein [Polyangiaceae bacterium]
MLVGSVEGADFTIGEALILERRGCLLRGTPEGKRAAAGLASDARYLVAPNQAITSREVTLLAGSAVDASMLDDAQVLADLVHKGVVIDRTKPPLSQLPTEVALREREADFE